MDVNSPRNSVHRTKPGRSRSTDRCPRRRLQAHAARHAAPGRLFGDRLAVTPRAVTVAHVIRKVPLHQIAITNSIDPF